MVFQTALRSLSNRSKVVVGNYCSSPITAEQYREKVRPLRPRRSYFAPAKARFGMTRWWALVEAPGTAPGSEWFIATTVYFHSRRTGSPNIGRKGFEKQGVLNVPAQFPWDRFRTEGHLALATPRPAF